LATYFVSLAAALAPLAVLRYRRLP